MNNHHDRANYIFSIADEVLRDDIPRGKYPDVILPFCVLRRLDCVLEPTKEKVLKRQEELTSTGIANPDKQLRRASGYSFYNTSKYTFAKMLEDPKNVGKNLRAYINGFSENIRDIIDKFKLRGVIETLEEKGLLFMLIQKFCDPKCNLHPDVVSNHDMGYVFEELIRRFNEQRNENPGEHFTPREVIKLMVHLVFDPDRDLLRRKGVLRSIYDPACGSGGMLSVAKEYLLLEINPEADVRLFGQEVNDETYAICKSDMLIKGDDQDAENIKPDTSFSHDGHPTKRFSYMLTNAPYGKDWKKEKTFIEAEASRGMAGRFGAGLPRISDGQLLFTQHMLSKMETIEAGGSRIAAVNNGSPLFTGDAGSGESEIRRWILENDWLEAIVSLPTQLFYNTGITTYVWVLTNRKTPNRKGKVLLINGGATHKVNGEEVEVFARKMKKSLGDKRNELGDDHIAELARLAANFKNTHHSKIFKTTDFAYRKITVERPLRLRVDLSSGPLARLRAACKEAKEEPVVKIVERVATKLGAGPHQDYNGVWEAILTDADKHDVKMTGKREKLFRESVCQRDEKAEPVIKQRSVAELTPDFDLEEARLHGDFYIEGKFFVYEPDAELRDYENVPFDQDIDDYFKREVLPHVSDAWINVEVQDEKDGKVGKVGYEINFNRYFYQYEPPRPLKAIEADIAVIEADIMKMLKDVTTTT